MDPNPTCPDCGSRMWLVTQAGAASHYECFHCPDKPRDLWWPPWNRPLCVGEHIGQGGIFRKYSYSTGRPAEAAVPKTGPMPTEATRHYSFVYCRCGHSNAVPNAKPDNNLSFFCKGCGHSLNYQTEDVRRGSVVVPLLSLRDCR
jgi:transposase-like protein